MMKKKLLLTGTFLLLAGTFQSASAEMFAMFTNNSKDKIFVTDLTNNEVSIMVPGQIHSSKMGVGWFAMNQKIEFGPGRGTANVQDLGDPCDAGGGKSGFNVTYTEFDQAGVPLPKKTKKSCVVEKRGAFYCAGVNIGADSVTFTPCH